MSLELTSDAFMNGQSIPAKYACTGRNISPALAWNEPPSGTQSLALVMDDPDAPSGTFRHWGAYDIPPGTRSIAVGQPIGKQAVNGFGKPGYGGPCPPKAHGPHHYQFKLYALDIDTLSLPVIAKVEEVEGEALKHKIGFAQLTATYERK